MAALTEAYKVLSRHARARQDEQSAVAAHAVTPAVLVSIERQESASGPGSIMRIERSTACPPLILSSMPMRSCACATAAAWGACLPVEGVNGGELRTVSCGELAAVISDVPQTEDGAIEDVWRDSEQVKHMVLEHHRVLRTMANCCTVLPLRFGAVFSSDDRVAVMLGAQRQRLCEALERHRWRARMGHSSLLRSGRSALPSGRGGPRDPCSPRTDRRDDCGTGVLSSSQVGAGA